LSEFNSIHKNIVKEGKFVKLNNYYEMDMINYSLQHVNFLPDKDF